MVRRRRRKRPRAQGRATGALGDSAIHRRTSATDSDAEEASGETPTTSTTGARAGWRWRGISEAMVAATAAARPPGPDQIPLRNGDVQPDRSWRSLGPRTLVGTRSPGASSAPCSSEDSVGVPRSRGPRRLVRRQHSLPGRHAGGHARARSDAALDRPARGLHPRPGARRCGRATGGDGRGYPASSWPRMRVAAFLSGMST